MERDEGDDEQMNDINAQAANILRRAATLVDAGWTRGVEARDGYGNACLVYSPDAKCWCALGALERASIELHELRIIKIRACAALHSAVGFSFTETRGARALYWDISQWNDQAERKKDEVIAALNKAANALEKDD